MVTILSTKVKKILIVQIYSWIVLKKVINILINDQKISYSFFSYEKSWGKNTMKKLFISNASTDPSDAQIDKKFLIINC